MPIFEYKCAECGEKFDVLHKSLNNMSDVNCTKCGSDNAKKLLSGFSASVDSTPDFGGCSTGSCGMPQMPMGGCANGMCGLN
ncbi:MAG: zinc ribbon domain-containing protein [Melioribacteraceae bacterium]|nr:zinc ribbon domain-containing protein [Melioribacteraceae bacterium]